MNVPIVFHVGTPFGCLCRLEHASPLLLDEVAVTFPKLRLLITHLGTLWHNESFWVVEKNRMSTSTRPPPTEIKTILTPDIITRIGPDKIIFGTDSPMPYAGKVPRMKEFVDVVKSIEVGADVLADIFHNNFLRLLEGDAAAGQTINAKDMLARLAGPGRPG
ncbi:MAG: amidohydrolase family protein [Elusimicrobia bacterium]|nr:amidohydrolase family protein [Elusimicrobiota bacterium]